MNKKDDVDNNNNNITNDYLEKLKQNSKIFEEKMILLNKRKLDKSRNNSKQKNTKKIDTPLKLSIRKEIQIDFKNTKKNERKKFMLSHEHQMTIINNYRNNNNIINNNNVNIMNNQNKNKVLYIENNISFNYIQNNVNFFSEEEQDVLFISKIRNLQKDIKLKTELIVELENKLKENDNKKLKMKNIEMNELYKQLEIISQENEEKMKKIKNLEAQNHNQRCIIDNLEAQIKNIKNSSKMKKEEINNLTNIVEKYQTEEGLYEQKINLLEAAKKSTIEDYELLKKNYNKLKNEKEKTDKVINDQKIEIDNYRKHINTLRRYICEDETSKNNTNDNNKSINTNYEDIINKSNKRNDNINKEKENIDNDKYYNYLSNGINKEKNIYNLLNKDLNDNGNKNNNQEIITSYQSTKKRHKKTKSDLMDKINIDDILQINQDDGSNKRDTSKSKSKNKEKASTSIKKRIERKIKNENNSGYKNLYFKTYNNFNKLKNVSSHSPKNETPKKEKIKINLNEMGYFPCEKYLIGREEELNNLESKLDILYKEKNSLESEIIKLPEHPKTLREIKIKKALNDQLEINEKNIKNVRTKIRKTKEV